ncbi:NAD(P)H-dependent flavin oxidoreductase [Streptococcus dysgalactiae]|uniref:Probable nitronate monooxygenase n=2 Tax=Streptococcus TaxID=1301 RepID=A0A9X8T1E1_STREQ|nr:nitronate monooxygenase [Streptococcus dysgalactiae]SQG92751.1 enoyl-[acyl-carrier protein] reductase II [Streptococcus dysgalactiae subsp. equisimilis]SUN61646.1 enoyl-[acyl-carrier protein] reductase II [Streptococcus dysgalactiae subsp. equisimilis]
MTSIEKLLNCRYPLLQGGMAYISQPKLVAAVSEAGGAGILTSVGETPTSLKALIDEVRQLTSHTFGVNLMLQQNNIAELVEVIVQEKVPFVTTGAGNPAPYLRALKEAGIKVLAVVGSVYHAKKMDALGVDAIIAEGQESGGHIGEISSMVLIPQVVDAVSVPVIGAGGVYDHRSISAMIALGAKGVQAGTIFLASQECQIPNSYKEKLLDANEPATIVTGLKYGHPVRSLKTTLVVDYAEKEFSGASKEELDAYIGDAYHQAVVSETDHGCYLAGQVAAAIRRIETVQVIVDRLFPPKQTGSK